MEKNFELLNVGAADMVNILSLDEMDDVVGGDVHLCSSASVRRRMSQRYSCL